MQKVVYMITTLFYPSIGGVENHIYNLSKNLVNLGYIVKIINPVINLGENEIYCLEDIEVNRISVGNKRDFKKYISYKKNSKGSFIGYFYGYKRKSYYNKFSEQVYKYMINDIKNQKNSQIIIHQHDFISSIKLSKKLAKEYNVIFTNHTGEFLFLKKLPLSNIIIKQLTKHFKYILAPSNELAAFEEIRDKKTYKFITNGVDIEKFRPVNEADKKNLRLKYNIPQDKIVIFCPRRWAPTKGIIYLIKAIEMLNDEKKKNLVFVFAGNECKDYPEYVEEINKEINKEINQSCANGNIILMGDVEYNKINELMKLSDIVVFPSLMEAISLAALEAMSCSKIVIATNVGGFKQIIVNEKTGFLVEAKNEKQLSSIIDDIAKNFSQYWDVGRNARKFVELGYSWNNITKQVSNIYENYLEWVHE